MCGAWSEHKSVQNTKSNFPQAEKKDAMFCVKTDLIDDEVYTYTYTYILKYRYMRL